MGTSACIHCERNYHSGPVGLAAVIRALLGGWEGQGLMHIIGGHCKIFRQHTDPKLRDPTDYGSLKRARDWAFELGKQKLTVVRLGHSMPEDRKRMLQELLDVVELYPET